MIRLDLVVIMKLSSISPTLCCYFTAVSQDKTAPKLFAVLDLHKERQTDPSSTGNRSAHFRRHSQEGHVVCKDIFGDKRRIRSAREEIYL